MSETTADGPRHQVLHFQTTAKASADARALAQAGLSRFDIVVDTAALIGALVLLLTGNVLLGVLVAVIAGLSLIGSRFHPFQRWLISKRFRSLLGRTTEVTIDHEGLRFDNPLGSSFVRWSSMTAVKSNSQTVAFVRDRLLLGYIPSIAFNSSAEQWQFVDFAQARIDAVKAPQRGS